MNTYGRNVISKNKIFRYIVAKTSKLANLSLHIHRTAKYFEVNFVLYTPMMTMVMMKKITAEPDVLASNKIADHNKSVGHFLSKSSVVVWLSREKYCPGH